MLRFKTVVPIIMADENRDVAGLTGAKTAPSSHSTSHSSIPPSDQTQNELSPGQSVMESTGTSAQGVPVTADDLAAAAIEATDTKDADHANNATAPDKGGTIHDAQEEDEAPYTTFSLAQKRLMVVCISMISLLSPLTGSIYLPAMNDIASDLGVRVSLINLTITTYQIFQGLAPSFIASFADTNGRRPAYLVALGIYVVANLALALQWSYPALMVLRCLQSAGSSATIALGGAVASDIATRAERGSLIGWASLGISLGPALGPVFGGLLSGYAGWRSIFWFLMALGGVLLMVVIAVVPETCRAVVGNGSVKPQKWNLSLAQWLKARKGKSQVQARPETVAKPRKRPNPLSAMKILLEPEGGITLSFGALLFAGYFVSLLLPDRRIACRITY